MSFIAYHKIPKEYGEIKSLFTKSKCIVMAYRVSTVKNLQELYTKRYSRDENVKSYTSPGINKQVSNLQEKAHT
jgi:hypothetical protein